MDWLQEYARALSADGPSIELTPAEYSAMLRLAREAAHRTGDRRNAPVATYLAGKFAAAGGDVSRAVDVADRLLPPPEDEAAPS